MDFFRSQRQARRRTLAFLALFILVVALVVALTAAVVWFGAFWTTPENRFLYARNTGGVVVLIIIAACIVRFFELRGGGGAVIAQHLGGDPLPASGTNRPEIQRFRNIAEEMAIASRTPMPVLYWLPQESSINAFAAGFTPADAVLAVTRGALEQLNRDELQGVIAHEFSHLLNGDMRLNTQVASWLFGVYGVHTYGHSILGASMRPSFDDSRMRIRPGGFWPLLYVFGGALAGVGYVGLLGGRLLQAAISRQREYLADASAVQFTRQTLGLANALKKIYFSSSLLRSTEAGAYSHFFIGEAVDYAGLFATHPPLIHRIQALDKSFDPDGDSRAEAGAQLDSDALHRALPLYFQPPTGAADAVGPAFNMRDGIALLFANLLEDDDLSGVPFAMPAAESADAVRGRQLSIIETDWGSDIAAQTRILEAGLRSQPIYLRLTRLRLMLAQLHTLSAGQRSTLRRTLSALIAANRSISLLEAALAYMVDQYLRDMARPSRVRIAGSLSLAQCAGEAALLERIVNDQPRSMPDKIVLDALDRQTRVVTSNAHAVDAALNRLNLLTMDDKKMLLQTLSDACPGASHEQRERLSLLAACLHAPPLSAFSTAADARVSTARQYDKGSCR